MVPPPSDATPDPTPDYLAALYNAESTLLRRARQMRKDAASADENGQPLRAAALRGKAIGLTHGADQIARVVARLGTEA